MRTSSLTVTILAVAAWVLTGLFFVPLSSQAENDVISEGSNATGITDLEVEGVLYDVTFVYATGIVVYGDPGEFIFDQAGAATEELSLQAAIAMREALNAAPEKILTVGPERTDYFYLATAEEAPDPNTPEFQVYSGWESRYDVPSDDRPPDVWAAADNWYFCIFDCVDDPDFFPLGMMPPTDRLVPYTYAKTVYAGGSPPAADAGVGGSVTGLVGSGLVLQNNGGDDEPISGDGSFTFNTLVAPGSSYVVTVDTQPSNPVQECYIAKGSGSVPAGGVDDVLVTCADPPAGDDFAYVSKSGNCDGNTPCYEFINVAITSQPTGTLIRITAEDYDEAVILTTDKNMVLSGGWNSEYSRKNSLTTINTLTSEDGSLVTDAIAMDGN